MNKISHFTVCTLLTAFVCTAGCGGITSSIHHPDPLAGWKASRSQDPKKLDQAIRDDYQDYIQKLPPKERVDVHERDIRFFEDFTGRHAVKILIILEGFWSDIWWDHVLIYDKNNKRIKTIKYKSGRSWS